MTILPRSVLLFLPDPGYFFWANSGRFHVIIASEIAAGFLILALLLWRYPSKLRPFARLSTIVAAVSWLSCYALTVWLLVVDPTRSSGDIPLPFPFAQFLGFDIVFLTLFSGVFLVFALVFAVLEFRKHTIASLLMSVGSVYCFLTLAWLAYYVFD